MADPVKPAGGIKVPRLVEARTERTETDSPSPVTAADPPAPRHWWATPLAKIEAWGWRHESGRPAPAAAAKPVAAMPSGPGRPASAGVLTLARAMLEAKGTAVTDADAQRLLDSTPKLAQRLSLLVPPSSPVMDKAAQQTALRNLMVNAPETLRGAGGSARADASDYARDVGFKDLSFENNRVAAITSGGDRVDLGALPAGASIEDLGKLVNASRFGTPSVAPPPPALQPSNTFNIENGHLAGHLSSLAYQDPATAKSQLEKWGYDVSTFRWIENKDSDTQAFVVNDKRGNTFVSFRGTESMQDAKTDADATLVPAPWAGPGVHVHEGFSGALDSVWPQLQTAVREARTAAGDKGDVVFTGHSLGGGLTTLAALRAANEGLTPADAARTKVYPIASPRVGDEQFSAAYNEKLPQTHRVVNFTSGLLANSQDVVTQVPPQSAGYRHVGNLVRLGDEGFRFIPRDDGAGQVSKDTGDYADSHIEKLQGDALKAYMEWCMVQSIDQRHAPPDRVTLPSFTAHFSGEYLRRTGASVLNR